MSAISDEVRKIYVRPTMKPQTWNNKVTEYIPDDFLVADKIHEAVRRLFEPEAGQVDYHAVQRGTLQHEIFENDSIEVWNIDDAIELKVNFRGCASENNPKILIPYALFAAFEMAPDCGWMFIKKLSLK